MIVGSGHKINEYIQLVKDLGIDNQVQFLGNISRSELGDYYLNADVVCIPSRNDPLPTVVLEAMVARKPVIGTNIGGIPFMIEDGVNGFIVPDEDFKSLANKLQYFISNPDEVKKMALSSRNKAIQQFSWEIIGKSLLSELIQLKNET